MADPLDADVLRLRVCDELSWWQLVVQTVEEVLRRGFHHAEGSGTPPPSTFEFDIEHKSVKEILDG